MENFNTQSEELDLSAGGIESMMDDASATTSNPEAEQRLMQQMSEQVGIESAQQMPTTEGASEVKYDEEKERQLNERLRKIRV